MNGTGRAKGGTATFTPEAMVRYYPRDRHGFTLIEMAVVVVIIGMLSIFGLPRIGAGFEGQAVRSASDAFITMHNKARITAVHRGRRTALMLGQTELVIRSTHPVTGAVDTVGNVEHLGDRFSVRLSASRDSLVFNPIGLGSEQSETVIYIGRGNTMDTLVISPAGRVRR